MWDSTSGKMLIIIFIAIGALFLLRMLSKQKWKLIKPTWKNTQTQPAPSAPLGPINLVPDVGPGF